ncbi:MAG: hydroxymethylbilane synthase [Myxococcales bacterium]|nr:hydroxymethylbilane synthase [Myxococcales bacterium]
MQKTIRIATRKSRLALWQAEWVQARLKEAGYHGELVLIETQGDREMTAFRLMQGQGFFTKAVQDAVLVGEADIAVHSLKDLPSARMEGLSLAAIPCRADVRDMLIMRKDVYLEAAEGLPLPQGAKVGTSAARRQAQLRMMRPDLVVEELRGNVPTRVERLREGRYDAILLACAGVTRLELDLSDLVTIALEPALFVPAPGQGALAIECRSDDARTIALLQEHLHDADAARTVELERGLMARFEGGCQLALGASARVLPQSQEVEMIAFYQEQHCTLRADAGAVVEQMFQVFGKKA